MLAWREVEKYTSSVEPELLISLRNVVLTFGVPFSAVFAHTVDNRRRRNFSTVLAQSNLYSLYNRSTGSLLIFA